MLPGNLTNHVYLSELLLTNEKFVTTCDELTAILDKYEIPYSFLKQTKDIWCRDYMPIQIEMNRYVQFRYEPSYLSKYLQLQSDPMLVCAANGLKPIFSNINLDGGNIVNWTDKALVSNRIFSENRGYEGNLVADIEKLLEAEVIIIPYINGDMTGHADGLVRFYNNNTIIGNNREEEYKYWKRGINGQLKKHRLNYIDIPFFEFKDKRYPDNAIGCYVNFLEVANLIVLPAFDAKHNKNEEVYDIFKEYYPERDIEMIDLTEIGKLGGLLNCITWTIAQ